MLRARVLYALAAAGAVLFYICYTQPLSGYVLWLTGLFPFFSLVVSLPCIYGTSLSFTADRPAAVCGAPFAASLRIKNRFGLPSAVLRTRLTVTNVFTGVRVRTTLRLSSPKSFAPALGCTPDHCGLLRYELRPRAIDLLGLCSLPLFTPPPMEALILPPAPPEDVSFDSALAGLYTVETEMGSPRDYRDGEPLRAIHWKLTARLDRLMIRENEKEETVRPLIVFDLFAAPDALDKMFCRLYAFSRVLLEKKIGHDIRWQHAETHAPQTAPIDCEDDLDACLRAVFSVRAPGKQNAPPFSPEALAEGYDLCFVATPEDILPLAGPAAGGSV